MVIYKTRFNTASHHPILTVAIYLAGSDEIFDEFRIGSDLPEGFLTGGRMSIWDLK